MNFSKIKTTDKTSIKHQNQILILRPPIAVATMSIGSKVTKNAVKLKKIVMNTSILEVNIKIDGI